MADNAKSGVVRLAVLGAGRIGKVHAANIAAMPGVRLAAIGDAEHGAASNLAACHGDCRAMELDSIFDDASIDGIIIGTPTPTHVDYIDRAVAARKPVFCEKPIDLDIARAQACVERSEREGVPLMVGFNRRFDPNFARTKAMIGNGEIGDLEVLTIISKDPAPPPMSYVAVSGGIFRDMMIHDFDLARFILDEDPVEVSAVGSVLIDERFRDYGDVDTAMVSMRTTSGRLCQINCSRRSVMGGDRRLEAFGSKGLLKVDNRLDGNIEIADSRGATKDPIRNNILDRHGPAFYSEIQEFVSSIKEGRAPTPGGVDGVKALRLADAATESLKIGSVVKIDW